MTEFRNALPNGPRVHVVFVPGFGGFDALGQIEYYPGTTELAQEWRKQKRGGERLVVHYFDNLPTAGIATRAFRLKRFLIKRCARNEFVAGDRIALVGHSTGGLDIRALLLDLEGLTHSADPVDRDQARALLRMIGRVVFLSVPQRGTNIADWVRSLQGARKLAIALLREATDVADTSSRVQDAGKLYARIRRNFPAWLEAKLDAAVPDLFAALSDVFTEVSQGSSSDPVLAADGREALADLQLWLGHTHGDFLALEDLAVLPRKRPWHAAISERLPRFITERGRAQKKDVTQLARATKEQRERERAMWKQHGIEVLSFATRAKPPHEPMRDGTATLTLRAWSSVLGIPLRGETDFLFRLVFTACSSGPFVRVRQDIESDEPDFKVGARHFPGGEPVRAVDIASWQNDGIVNTASMLWPNGGDTWLVDADHGDIIGHYKQRPLASSERKFWTYDIFGSNSGMNDTQFQKVWFAVFEHCAGALQDLARV
jgi:triacylglycerol lipase